MSITKVKLIADSVISNVHINSLTTDALTEGEKLFYTDARVSSYLAANNFATTGAGYFYDATLSANILTFSKSDGTTDSVDLSLYLDDTNLARLVSGTLDALTGVATFTRDDSSTFTIDFSAFLSDANDYVSSGSFNTTTGVLTLTRLGGGTVTVDLDGKYAEASHTHLWADITDRPTSLSAFTNDLGNYGGFLTSFTETDPVYVASSWYTTTNNSSNWNAAYGWGDHATAGYLTSFTETDPTVPSHVKSITTTNISNWDTAYGWGNHASAGYLTSVPTPTKLVSPNGGTVVAADSALPDAGHSFIHTLGLGPSGNDGHILGMTWANTTSSYGAQIFIDTDPTNTMAFRSRSAAGVWTGWNTVVHSGNIGSQSVNYATSAGTATDSSKLPLTGGTLSGTLILGSVASAGSSAILNTNGFIRVSEHVLIHNPANLSMAQGISWDSSTNGLYTYTESATGTLRATGSMRAPIFYDSDDTGYYLNPHATSNLNVVQAKSIRNDGSVASDDGFGIYWSDDAETSYAIYRESGAWSSPFPDLRIAFHTGIKLGANASYNGIRFYTDYDMATQVMSVNNSSDGYGAGHVHVNGIMHAGDSHRAPIFYDSNDTAYYLNPAGGSRLRNLYVGDSGDDWSDPGGWGTQVRFSNGPHVKFVLHARSPGIEAGMYVHTPSSVYIGSYTSHPVNMMVGGNSRLLIEDGRVYSHVYSEAAGSSRAPIFYDSNNTGYYVDPASTSNLASLSVANTISGSVSGSAGSVAWGNVYSKPAGWLNATNLVQTNEPNTSVPSGFYQSYLGAGNPTGTWFNYINVRHDNPSNGHGYQLGMSYYDNNLWFRSYQGGIPSSYQSWEIALATGGSHQIKSGILQSNASLRAPIFYDTNDTGYYTDPASTSYINGLNVGVQTWRGNITWNSGVNIYVSGESSFDILSSGAVWQVWTAHDAQPSIYVSYCGRTEIGQAGCRGLYVHGSLENTGCGIYTNGLGTSVARLQSYQVDGDYYGTFWRFGTFGIVMYPSTGEEFCYDTCNGALYIGGTIYQNYYSDCKYKENVTVIESALDKIDGIRGVEFDWNALGQEEIHKSGHEVGFIAQEVQAVYPQAVREVHKEREDKIVSALVIDQEKLIPLLLQGIKELKSEVKALKEHLNIS